MRTTLICLEEPYVQIEPTVRVIKKVEKGDVELVAPNYGFNIPVRSNFSTEGVSSDESFQFSSVSNTSFTSKIVTSNTGVTVAILDTGIDADLQAFSVPFLHNSSIDGLCGEISGYDFVNRDVIPEDLDTSRHGSGVTYVVHNKLLARNVSHQILPVKIADSDGQSNFFTVLCGLSYSIKMKVDVINMSFGWTYQNQDVYDMFSKLISSTSIPMVTSAGNKNADNDAVPHYPSNFPQNHVLAVAASKSDVSDAALYSNYGFNTVDFFAIGNQIQFPLGLGNSVIHYKGTSFASPWVAAKVAEIVVHDVSNLRAELRHEFAVPIQFQKPTVYHELIR